MNSWRVFLDIDGTLMEGSARERAMVRAGLVRGAYGDPSRSYPQGKEAFLTAFNHPDVFGLDTTLPDAVALLDVLRTMPSVEVFVLTARDVEHHEAIRADLDHRGLWFDGMRLLCKPHRTLCTTPEYKLWTFTVLTEGCDEEHILYVENADHLRDNARALRPRAHIVPSCSEALSIVGGMELEGVKLDD